MPRAPDPRAKAVVDAVVQIETMALPDARSNERLQFTAEASLILFIRGRHADHGADARLAALVGQQGAHQSLAVNPVGLGAAMSA